MPLEPGCLRIARKLGHDPIACGDPREAEGLLARHPGIRLIVSDVLMATARSSPARVKGLRNTSCPSNPVACASPAKPVTNSTGPRGWSAPQPEPSRTPG
jgi:hypothetical protein